MPTTSPRRRGSRRRDPRRRDRDRAPLLCAATSPAADVLRRWRAASRWSPCDHRRRTSAGFLAGSRRAVHRSGSRSARRCEPPGPARRAVRAGVPRVERAKYEQSGSIRRPRCSAAADARAGDETAFDAAPRSPSTTSPRSRCTRRISSASDHPVRVRRAARASSIPSSSRTSSSRTTRPRLDGRQEPPLPAERGEPREVSAPIYTRKVKIEDAKSLLVLPLLAADEPVGTLSWSRAPRSGSARTSARCSR